MKIQLKSSHNQDDFENANQIAGKVGSESDSARSDQATKPESEGIKLSNLALILSMPMVGAAIIWGVLALVNPFVLFKSEVPDVIFREDFNPPKTLAEIKGELTDSQLQLGEKLQLAIADSIYPVLRADNKEIVEIRVYKPEANQKSGKSEAKLRLVTKINTSGLDESFVKALSLKSVEGKNRSATAQGRRLPLKQLQPINGDAPSQGHWFMATGKSGSNTYGKAFYYISDPKPFLATAADWSSPATQYPQWREFTSVPNVKNPPPPSKVQNAQFKPLADNEPELVLDQTQGFEPNWQVFKVEQKDPVVSPLQLRQITLNEGRSASKAYSNGLLLASVGLWSPAKDKFDTFKAELQTKGENFVPFMQEQYELISFHAEITKEQANKPTSDAGEQVMLLIVDGRWQAALNVATASNFTTKGVVEVLKKYSPSLWARVKAALKVQPASEIKTWGSLIMLQRGGLIAAADWLKAQKGDSKQAIALLYKFDLAPLKMAPKQFLGTVRNLGKNAVSREWFIDPPKLMAGENWYEVDVGIIRSGNDVWENAPFAELGERSPLIIWQSLGLESNPNLVVNITQDSELTQVLSLTAKSLWVGRDGQVRVLASAPEDLANAINGNLSDPDRESSFPAMVTDGRELEKSGGFDISTMELDSQTEEKIVNTIYDELQVIGQISLSPEEFKQQIRQWLFRSVDVTGDGKPDLVMKLERYQIDIGDRRYPIVLAFDYNGSLLYNDINDNTQRRWVDILPSAIGQVLMEANGRYEAVSFKSKS